ncbi:hypothetical protein YSKK_26300 [Halopseudomonas aestusnigri]|nr:hypothetical protein YSKK_26300 [Halopseudomonas aestusnigri]
MQLLGGTGKRTGFGDGKKGLQVGGVHLAFQLVICFINNIPLFYLWVKFILCPVKEPPQGLQLQGTVATV